MYLNSFRSAVILSKFLNSNIKSVFLTDANVNKIMIQSFV